MRLPAHWEITYTVIQPAIRPISDTSPRLNPSAGRQRNPAPRSDGNSAAVCAITPSVVPMPSSCTPVAEMFCGVLPRPTVTTYRPPTTITTRLLMTGVHIGAANRPRVFSTAPISELMP